MTDLTDKIEAFLASNGIEYQDSSRSFIVECPKCNKKKFYINKSEGYFICFHCAEDGVKGSTPFYGLALLSGLSKEEIKHTFDNEVPNEIPKPQHIKPTKKVYIPNRFIPITDENSILGAKYLLGRGLPTTIANAYNIKYDPSKKQVIFSIRENDEVVGFQGRSVDPNCPKEEQKYTSPGFEKSKHFIFQEYLKGDKAIICEGPISAIKFQKTGVPFLASMGKAISSSQMDKLLALGVKHVYLALDPDAFNEINKFILKYRSKFDIYFVEVPKNKEDFGDCTFDECCKAYSKATQVYYPIEIDSRSMKWMF